MPRASPYEIELTEVEREQLQCLARKYTAPYQEVVRAKIVLLASEGYSNSEIASRLDFQRHYEKVATPFEWKFTREDLHKLLARLEKEQSSK